MFSVVQDLLYAVYLTGQQQTSTAYCHSFRNLDELE